MKSIVICTTYNRPQYLRLCLEYLQQAEGIDSKEIWICIDRGRVLYRDICEILNDFPRLHFHTFVREPHSYHGNTYNTMEAYKDAYASNAKFIYLVEDDVLVRPDFFKWHEAVQSRNDFFCSIAYKCIRNGEARTDVSDETAYFTSRRDYASIGVCWKREKLAFVIEHAKPEYYSDLPGYIAQRFPNNRFSDCFTEQDGIIMRILDEIKGKIVWPYTPRAYHIGFSGYNRPRGKHLTYNELCDIIHDSDKVHLEDRDFNDIEPIPLIAPSDWNTSQLHCVQEFE